MLRPGFEPESSARKAEMIGRTTPPEQIEFYKFINMGPMGFEPMAFRLWAGRSTWLSYGPLKAPSTGLEPVTNRLTAERSTYWATMACIITHHLNQIKPMFKNQKTLNSNSHYVFTSI